MAGQKEAKMAVAIAVQANVPVLLWGAPGCGKTAFVKSLANTLNWHLYTMIAAIHEPADVSGLPFRDGEDEVMKFLPPKWIYELSKTNKDTIVFLDELDKADRMTQNAYLRLILEKAVNEIILPDCVRFIAAANPPDAGGDWELSPPLANRFVHIQFPADPIVFSQAFVVGEWNDRDIIPIIDREKMENALPKWRALIAAFIQRFPSSLHSFPQEVSLQGKAWASPRTWEYTSILMAACEATDKVVPEEVRAILVEGCVGKEATAFLTFVHQMDIPSPQEILQDFSKLPLKHPDKIYVCLASIPQIVESRELAIKSLELVKFLDRQKGSDFALLLLRWLKPVIERLIDRDEIYDILKNTRLVEKVILGR